MCCIMFWACFVNTSIYIYGSVVEVWCVGGILCVLVRSVACTSFSYIAGIACPDQVAAQYHGDNTASVVEGIQHNKLHLRPSPQINKLRMSKKIGNDFSICNPN